MPAITEAQIKRIRDIRIAFSLRPDLKSLEPPITQADVKMLIDRIENLDAEQASCADEIVQWALDRVTEDLASQKEWLADCIEQARTAELMVREAEHALAALQALKDGAIYQSGGEINARWDDVAALYRSQGMLPVAPEAPEEEPQAEAPKDATAAAGRIEIISDNPEKGTPRPNIYRFIEVAQETASEAPPEPEPAAPEPPVPAEEAAEKLAGAWGATVNRKPPKPTGLVSQSSSLRDRILATLGKAACTTSGLASMLEVKELAVCQTLDAMKHEGSVAPDEMPEAGRRAQLWRLPEQTAS